MWPSIDFHLHTMSLNSRDKTWWIPGLPFAVGGPSKKVNGELSSILDSMDLENVPSSCQISIKEFSSPTGSSSPGEAGTLIGQAT
jgi:hypothetical protein